LIGFALLSPSYFDQTWECADQSGADRDYRRARSSVQLNRIPSNIAFTAAMSRP
jgi:hypothetical protein